MDLLAELAAHLPAIVPAELQPNSPNGVACPRYGAAPCRLLIQLSTAVAFSVPSREVQSSPSILSACFRLPVKATAGTCGRRQT
jgi:hypothetical protein